MARKTTETELGTEAQCARCQEFWPADGDFFYTSNGKLHSWCKACYDARRTAKRAAARTAASTIISQSQFQEVSLEN
ncbi:Uncharacterised protein [Bordetella ansorpii]|uniref:Uncharacterized protein n=1 Tax=Bordetella ansorpii TaxID=288768 RepID=A0A157SX17_9BORD|nr:hypothetical protein [Bordetella ansorpii]SAI74603.1 Uncharacterised protein [Bordetella ansorpii]